MINLETKYASNCFKNKTTLNNYQKQINLICENIKDGKASGIEMTGWINYFNADHQNEIDKMLATAKLWKSKKIKKIVVIGIGGSYLGVKAGVDMLTSYFCKKTFEVLYVHNFNQNYISSLLSYLKDEPFGIIIISKSGTTLEPAVCFNLLKNLLIKNVGKTNANNLIAAVTDKNKGTLHDLAINNKWVSFIIPDNIGGRYSALTPVGMLLFVLLGFDYKQIINGAKDACKNLLNPNLSKNSAFKYACYRHYFKTVSKMQVENFIVYDPSLQMICEVWKQLFGESEGKEHKALYPSTSLFTTDLHSMGQYLQDGTRNFFETTLFVKESNKDITLKIKNDDDKLLYLNNKKLSYLNQVAMLSTVQAHFVDGKANNLIIYLDKHNAYHFGYLYMWLCFAAMASAYLLKLNPFNQPGVEVYKKRIKETLKNK